VIVVAKTTALQRYIEEGRDPRVGRLLERSDPSVRQWRKAHDDHNRALEEVTRVLDDAGADSWAVSGLVGRFDSEGIELVVTVGGDGTLLAASHNVGSTRLLGVNSSPGHSVGFFCAARPGNIRESINEALEGSLRSVCLARMRVDVGPRTVSSRVLNEALLCHAIPAATSRYILQVGREREEQRSSGLWVGTAAGSTGALRSAGGRVLPLTSRKFQVVVREPYSGSDHPYELTRVVVDQASRVTVKSKMQDACLFLDGPFKQVRVHLGEKVVFRASDQPLNVLGLTAQRGTARRSVKSTRAKAST